MILLLNIGACTVEDSVDLHYVATYRHSVSMSRWKATQCRRLSVQTETQIAITKIHQLDSSICGEQDVVALDISMDYSVAVQVLEALMWKSRMWKKWKRLKTWSLNSAVISRYCMMYLCKRGLFFSYCIIMVYHTNGVYLE